MSKAMESYELFFELSHKDRVRILRLLKENPRRMSHISKDIDVTTAEVSRHIERLTKVNLIQKKGTHHHLTSFGAIVLNEISKIDYLIDKREYIMTHDLSVVPEGFLNLDTISRANLMKGTFEVVASVKDLSVEAKEYVDILSPQSLRTVVDVNVKKAKEGIPLRIIYQRGESIPEEYRGLKKADIKVRMLDKVEFAVKMNEQRGGIVFPDTNGKLDFEMALMGSDEIFHSWLKCLFEHTWNSAKPV